MATRKAIVLIDGVYSECPAADILANMDMSAAAILSPTTSARNVIQPSGAAVVPLTLKGYAGQTAVLQSFQNSAGVNAVSFAIPTEPTTGAELITNAADRDFSGANNWTGVNWSISGGAYVHTAGANGAALAGYAPTIGAVYKVLVTIVTTTAGGSTAAGGIYVRYGGVNSSSVGKATGTITAYEFVLTATAATGLSVVPDATWAGSIDDISIMQITPAVASINAYNSAGLLGYEVRSNNTNLGIGLGSLKANTGIQNAGIGVNSLVCNSSGGYNNAHGYNSLAVNTTGHHNAAFGSSAMILNTIGYNNCGIGAGALRDNVDGYNNTGIGGWALLVNSVGHDNTAIGANALYANTTANYTTAVGSGALTANTTGLGNTAVGGSCMLVNTIGANNTALGMTSLWSCISGGSNTALGRDALRYATGSFGTACGAYAGNAVTTGANNTFLGYQADLSSSTQRANAMALGYQAKVDQDNSCVIGVVGATAYLVGINTTTPGAQFHAVARSDATIGAIVRGYSATQSANLFEAQTSASAVAFGIAPLGNVTILGTETTVTNKNKYQALLADAAGPVIKKETYYWNGASYVADNTWGFGTGACANNTGSYSCGIGGSALGSNTGSAATAVGIAAMQYNTGTNSNALGNQALINNTGAYANGFGGLALYNNTGAQCQGFGYMTLFSNIGANCMGFGHQSMISNIGATCVGFGNYSLGNNNWPNKTAIGHQASAYFLADAATDQAFAYADVDGTAHTITYGSPHGFGVVGSKINLKFTTTAGTPPTGLVSTVVYLFTVTSTTVLTLAAITSKGSADFTGKLTNSVDTSNSIAIGVGTNASKANQVYLGPDTITETVVHGMLTSDKITAKVAVPGSFADLAAVQTYLASILT